MASLYDVLMIYSCWAGFPDQVECESTNGHWLPLLLLMGLRQVRWHAAKL